MWISKQWLKEELDRQREDIARIDKQARCSHDNHRWVRGVYFGGFVKICADCEFEKNYSEKEAIPLVIKHHETIAVELKKELIDNG